MTTLFCGATLSSISAVYTIFMLLVRNVSYSVSGGVFAPGGYNFDMLLFNDNVTLIGQ